MGLQAAPTLSQTRKTGSGGMTLIKWTDRICNPIVGEDGGWWCAKLDEQCDYCYAEALNHKPFFRGNHFFYRFPGPSLTLRQDLIDRWARLRMPQKHFICSLTDMFGPWVSFKWHFSRLNRMAAAPNQTFQLLTKHPVTTLRSIIKWLQLRHLSTLPANIWVGVRLTSAARP